MSSGLTLGLVSTTYMKSLRGLDLKMASSICSSSRQRALKPDRGWLLRQMAAWEEARGTQASDRNVYLSISSELLLWMTFRTMQNTICENQGEYKLTELFLPLHVQFQLINHTISYLSI